jgi:hypothetical protein
MLRPYRGREPLLGAACRFVDTAHHLGAEEVGDEFRVPGYTVWSSRHQDRRHSEHPIRDAVGHAVDGAAHALHEVAVAKDTFRPEILDLPNTAQGHARGAWLGLRHSGEHNAHGMGGVARLFGGRLPVIYPGGAFTAASALLVAGATATAATNWPSAMPISFLDTPIEVMTAASIGTTAATSLAILWSQKDRLREMMAFRRYGPDHTYLLHFGMVGPAAICITGFKVGHLLAPQSALAADPGRLPLGESVGFGLAMLPYALDIPVLLAGLVSFMLANRNEQVGPPIQASAPHSRVIETGKKVRFTGRSTRPQGSAAQVHHRQHGRHGRNPQGHRRQQSGGRH